MRVSVLFSEPKIPQFAKNVTQEHLFSECFSALQRAENSSITDNADVWYRAARCFSALQRAENSSIRVRAGLNKPAWIVSVLFSEPKIPQWYD